MDGSEDQDAGTRLSFAELRSRFSGNNEQRQAQPNLDSRVARNPGVSNSRAGVSAAPQPGSRNNVDTDGHSAIQRPSSCIVDTAGHNATQRPSSCIQDTAEHNTIPRPASCSADAVGMKCPASGSGCLSNMPQTVSDSWYRDSFPTAVSHASWRPPIPPKTKRPLSDSFTAVSDSDHSSSLAARTCPPPVPPKSTRPRPASVCNSTDEAFDTVDQVTMFSGRQVSTVAFSEYNSPPLTSSNQHPSSKLEVSLEDACALENDVLDLSSTGTGSAFTASDLPLVSVSLNSNSKDAQYPIDTTHSLDPSSKGVSAPLDINNSPVVWSGITSQTNNIPNNGLSVKSEKKASRTFPEDSLPLLEHDSLDLDSQTTPQSQATPQSVDSSGDFSVHSSSSSVEPIGYEQINADTFIEEYDLDRITVPPDSLVYDTGASSNRPESYTLGYHLPLQCEEFDLPEFREFRPVFYNDSLVATMCERIARVGRRRRRQDTGADAGRCAEEKDNSLVRSLNFDSDELCPCRQDAGGSGSQSSGDGDTADKYRTLLAEVGSMENRTAISRSSSQAFSPVGPDPLIGCHDDFLVHSDLESDVPVSSHDIELAFPPPELEEEDMDGSDADGDEGEGMESDDDNGQDHGGDVIAARYQGDCFTASRFSSHSDDVWGSLGRQEVGSARLAVGSVATSAEEQIDEFMNTAANHDTAQTSYDSEGGGCTFNARHNESEPSTLPMQSLPRVKSPDIGSSYAEDIEMAGVSDKDIAPIRSQEAGSDSETIADLTPPDGLIYGDEDPVEIGVGPVCDEYEDEISKALPDGSPTVALTDVHVPDSRVSLPYHLHNSLVKDPIHVSHNSVVANPPSLSKNPSADSTISSDYLDNGSADLSSSDCGYCPGQFGSSRPESMVGEVGSPPGSVTSEYVSSEAVGSIPEDYGRRTSCDIISFSNNNIFSSCDVATRARQNFPVADNQVDRENADMPTPVQEDFPSPPPPIENGSGFGYEEDCDDSAEDGFGRSAALRRTKEKKDLSEIHTDNDVYLHRPHDGEIGDLSCDGTKEVQRVPDGSCETEYDQSTKSSTDINSVPNTETAVLNGIDSQFYNKNESMNASAGNAHELPERCDPASRAHAITGERDHKTSLKQHVDIPGRSENVGSSEVSVEGNVVDSVTPGEITASPATNTTTVSTPQPVADIVIAEYNGDKTAPQRMRKGKRKKKRPLQSVKRVSFRLRQDR
ncbi:hypothetical protein ElyMa_006520600 [Elysia marginata]|uniref:Uncharacterized protein n=1 Tax=Elysia marginata TaxID=1093978 RepID=A0AAV4I6D5_9GAST|nr:hypothetical protein ElyMa_006520600 [Elysia marginata]